MQSGQTGPLWPIIVYSISSLVLVIALIGVSYLVGQRHTGRATGEPYESGMVPTGSAWMVFDVKYYLVAMFFVIFDLEAVFLFAWAVAVREAGWRGFGEAIVFVAILGAALVYIWRIGALEWGPQKSVIGSVSGLPHGEHGPEV